MVTDAVSGPLANALALQRGGLVELQPAMSVELTGGVLDTTTVVKGTALSEPTEAILEPVARAADGASGTRAALGPAPLTDFCSFSLVLPPAFTLLPSLLLLPFLPKLFRVFCTLGTGFEMAFSFANTVFTTLSCNEDVNPDPVVTFLLTATFLSCSLADGELLTWTICLSTNFFISEQSFFTVGLGPSVTSSGLGDVLTIAQLESVDWGLVCGADWERRRLSGVAVSLAVGTALLVAALSTCSCTFSCPPSPTRCLLCCSTASTFTRSVLGFLSCVVLVWAEGPLVSCLTRLSRHNSRLPPRGPSLMRLMTYSYTEKVNFRGSF